MNLRYCFKKIFSTFILVALNAHYAFAQDDFDPMLDGQPPVISENGTVVYSNQPSSTIRPSPPPAPVAAADQPVAKQQAPTGKAIDATPSLATIITQSPTSVDRVTVNTKPRPVKVHDQILTTDSEHSENADDSTKDSGKSRASIKPTNSKKPTQDEVVYRVNLGRADDIELLIKKGASVDETNASGVPIICLAATRSDNEGLEIVKVLVEAGADINKADKRGQNALFYAAKVGNKEVVKYLLSEQIRYTALDTTGNNARIIAYQTGHNEIIEILDNFVLQQNNEVRMKYAEVNKELQERYNAYNAAILAQVNKNNEKVAKMRNDRISELVREISFSSCAASYWKFCDDNKQKTQLGYSDLLSNIKAHSSKVREYVDILATEQKVMPNNVDHVVSGSEEQIKRALSNISSHESGVYNGIGTIDDMKKRCDDIADSWRIKGQFPALPADNSTNSKMPSAIDPTTGFR